MCVCVRINTTNANEITLKKWYINHSEHVLCCCFVVVVVALFVAIHRTRNRRSSSVELGWKEFIDNKTK